MKEKEDINMVVEISKGSLNKYEYKTKENKWVLDRVLEGDMAYPEEYGFIPNTLNDDDDLLDVICINIHPIYPGFHVPIRIIGFLEMIDEGKSDDKIIAVNAVEPRLYHINNLKDIEKEKLNEIVYFFSNYKGKKTEIKGIKEKEYGKELLKKCQILHESKKKNWKK